MISSTARNSIGLQLRAPPAASAHRHRRSVCVKADPNSITLNFNNAVDKSHEKKSLKAVIGLRPSALEGLGPRSDDLLATLKIASIKDLGTYQFFKTARAIKTLAETEDAGNRSTNSMSNINGALKAAYEHMSLAELVSAPVSTLAGISPEKETSVFEPLGIKTIGDLASWRYALWAEAMVELSNFENEDFSS